VVLSIGALFTIYGIIAMLVAIPHVAVIPIAIAVCSVLGGMAAIFGLWWAKYLLYVVALAFSVHWIGNVFELQEQGFIGDTISDFGIEAAPGILIIVVLAVCSYLVSIYIQRDASDT
jgi:hypothetical protein